MHTKGFVFMVLEFNLSLYLHINLWRHGMIVEPIMYVLKLLDMHKAVYAL
jgi:hypothetical protein